METIDAVHTYLQSRPNLPLTVKNIQRHTNLTRKQVKYAVRYLEHTHRLTKTLRSPLNVKKHRPVYTHMQSPQA